MNDRRYGTLTDGVLTYAPRVLTGAHGESIITGGDDADLYLAHGYKPIIYAQPPSEEGYTYTPNFVENETSIVREWAAEPIPADDNYELLDIITGEVTT